jgi:8-oxo-dGTP diphosphatase
MSKAWAGKRDLVDIEWDKWQACDPATLVFVFRGDELLLIDKKTGLGRGKVNAPGGKVDDGEGPEDGAIRECQEELGITVSDLEYCGQHRFQFVDGYSIHVWVFRTQSFDGVPSETREAKPMWVRQDQIPFDAMWEDDKYWLPMVIRGERFQTRWIFDDDRMLDFEIEPDGTIESWEVKPLNAEAVR